MEKKVIALCLIAAMIFSGCGGNKAAETMATDTTPKVETAEPEKTVTKIEPEEVEQSEEMPSLPDLDLDECFQLTKDFFDKADIYFGGKVDGNEITILIAENYEEETTLQGAENLAQIAIQSFAQTCAFKNETLKKAELPDYYGGIFDYYDLHIMVEYNDINTRLEQIIPAGTHEPLELTQD